MYISFYSSQKFLVCISLRLIYGRKVQYTHAHDQALKGPVWHNIRRLVGVQESVTHLMQDDHEEVFAVARKRSHQSVHVQVYRGACNRDEGSSDDRGRLGRHSRNS